MEILQIILGLIVGLLIGWLLAKSKGQSALSESNNEIIKLKSQQQAAESNLSSKSEELQKKENTIQEYINELSKLKSQIASLEAFKTTLEEKLKEQKDNQEKNNEELLLKFKALSQNILDENSQKIADKNKDHLEVILNPLQLKIKEFQEKVETTNLQDEKRNATLVQEILQLKHLNKEITEDAKSLTKALRGDSKTQGNWGEFQLEKILESAGLIKDTHYRKEENFKNEEGKNQRLDYIIDLPDGKNIIIDSKVSLTAYTNFVQTEDEAEGKRYIKEHLDSLRLHIKGLSAKKYHELYGITTPSYVLMFVANEPALTLALREDPSLFEEALKSNLVLVGTSTLLATLRTISYIWKQDAQSKNADEIARQAGDLYDKFVGFTSDLLKLGSQLKTVKGTYDDAMNKLTEGSGNLVRRTERLRTLGASPNKQIEPKLLDRSDDE